MVELNPIKPDVFGLNSLEYYMVWRGLGMQLGFPQSWRAEVVDSNESNDPHVNLMNRMIADGFLHDVTLTKQRWLSVDHVPMVLEAAKLELDATKSSLQNVEEWKANEEAAHSSIANRADGSIERNQKLIKVGEQLQAQLTEILTTESEIAGLVS